MRRTVYRIKRGTSIQVESDGRYAIQAPDNPHTIRLQPPAVAPLLLLDGWNSEEMVGQKLAELGAELPPGEIGPLFSKLILLGLLVEEKTDWSPLGWLPWPIHRCQGCGSSCQGHWIGPLSQEFLEKTQSRMEELRAKYPQLRGQKPFVRLDPADPDLYLNSSSGQCLFLDEEMRCILHNEYGCNEKPHVCQMFPTVRVEDSESTRVGIGLTCLKGPEQVLDREPDAPKEHWRRLHAGLDGRMFRSYPNEANDGEELRLLEIAQESDDAVTAIIDELDVQWTHVGPQPGPIRLERLARKYLVRVEAALAEEPLMDALCKREGILPELLGSIRAIAQEPLNLPDSELLLHRAVISEHSERLRIVSDMLQRFFFLRIYRHFPEMAYAVAAFCLGLWTTTALIEVRESDDMRFGQLLAVWMRILRAPTLQTGLFANFAEVDEFLWTYQTVAC